MTDHVLLIAPHYPPDTAAGAVRAGAIAQQLRSQGFAVVVLALGAGRPWRRPSDMTLQTEDGVLVARVASRDLMALGKKLLGLDPAVDIMSQLAAAERGPVAPRRAARLLGHVRALVRGLQAWSTYPGFRGGWFPLRQSLELIRTYGVVAIISTSPPPKVHRLAAVVAKAADLPWVADLRDLWVDNYYYPWGPLRSWLERRLERRVLNKAAVLTTVSGPFGDQLREAYPSRRVEVIMNAIDPTELAEPASPPRNSCLRLAYTGVIYAGNQPLETLLAGLAALAEGPVKCAAELHVAAPEETWHTIVEAARPMGLLDYCVYHGHVSRDRARQLQRSADVLTVLGWTGERSLRGFVPSKVFEYLAARRPILVVGSARDVVSELVVAADAGRVAETASDVTEALRGWHREWLRSGEVICMSDEQQLQAMSQTVLGAKFAAVLTSQLAAHR